MLQKLIRLFCVLVFIPYLIVAMHKDDPATADESLFNAVVTEKWGALTAALENGGSPLYEIPLFGSYASHYAVCTNIPNEHFEKMVRAAKQHGAIDTQNSFGKTELALAQENNNDVKVAILKTAGASIM